MEETKFVKVGANYLLVCDHNKKYNLKSNRMIFIKSVHGIEDAPDGIKITYYNGFGYEIVYGITVWDLHKNFEELAKNKL